eukprot:4955932-Amphidinium_carterae.1
MALAGSRASRLSADMGRQCGQGHTRFHHITSVPNNNSLLARSSCQHLQESCVESASLTFILTAPLFVQSLEFGFLSGKAGFHDIGTRK